MHTASHQTGPQDQSRRLASAGGTLGRSIVLLVLLAFLTGCGDPSEEVRLRTDEFFRDLTDREAGQLSDFFHTTAAPVGLHRMAAGPVVFRSYSIEDRVQQVNDTWCVRYRVEMSDYPSALFGFLVNEELLKQPHRMRPYEATVSMSGRLYWQKVSGKWKIARAPAPHEPVGRAWTLSQQADRWQADLPSEAEGITALGQLLPLLEDTKDDNHAGNLSREEILSAIAKKLDRAEDAGMTSVLKDRFLPGSDSASEAIQALSALNQLLLPWWHGRLEDAANVLSGVEQKHIALEDLQESLVRLHAYHVISIKREPPNSYVISVALTISKPSQLLTMIVCPVELPDPRERLERMAEPIEHTEAFLVTRHGGRWLVSCEGDSGSVGYAVRSARAARVLRQSVKSYLSARTLLFRLELRRRLRVVAKEFTGMHYAPTESLRDTDRVAFSKLSKEIEEQILDMIGEVIALKSLSRPERCFLLGRKLSLYSFYAQAVQQGSSNAVADLERTAESIRKITLALGLKVSGAQVTQALSELKHDSESAINSRPPRIMQWVKDHCGSEMSHICEAGFDAELVDTIARMGNRLDEVPKHVNLIFLLTVKHLLDELKEVPSTNAMARATVIGWMMPTGKLPSKQQTANVIKFDWLFNESVDDEFGEFLEDLSDGLPQPEPPWDIDTMAWATRSFDTSSGGLGVFGSSARQQYELSLMFGNSNPYSVEFDSAVMRLEEPDSLGPEADRRVTEARLAWYEKGRTVTYGYGGQEAAPPRSSNEHLGDRESVKLQAYRARRVSNLTLHRIRASRVGEVPTIISMQLLNEGKEVAKLARAVLPPLDRLPFDSKAKDPESGFELHFVSENKIPKPSEITNWERIRQLHRAALEAGPDERDPRKIRLLSVEPNQPTTSSSMAKSADPPQSWRYRFWTPNKLLIIDPNDVANVRVDENPLPEPPDSWMTGELIRECVIDCDIAVLIAKSAGAKSGKQPFSLQPLRVSDRDRIAWLVPFQLKGNPVAVAADSAEVLVSVDSGWRLAEQVIWNPNWKADQKKEEASEDPFKIPRDVPRPPPPPEKEPRRHNAASPLPEASKRGSFTVVAFNGSDAA